MRNSALAVPFFVVLLGAPLVVAPLGDRVGRGLAQALGTSAPPAAMQASAPPVVVVADAPLALADEPDAGDGGDARVRPRAGTKARDAGVSDAGAAAEAGAPSTSLLAAPSSGTIVVPKEKVERALVKKDVAAQNAIDKDGRPLGARLSGVGKYGVGLRDGDVVVAVEGRRTPDVGAMVSVAMGAAAAGSGAIRGRILRGDAVWDVVLHVPKD